MHRSRPLYSCEAGVQLARQVWMQKAMATSTAPIAAIVSQLSHGKNHIRSVKRSGWEASSRRRTRICANATSM